MPNDPIQTREPVEKLYAFFSASDARRRVAASDPASPAVGMIYSRPDGSLVFASDTGSDPENPSGFLPDAVPLGEVSAFERAASASDIPAIPGEPARKIYPSDPDVSAKVAARRGGSQGGDSEARPSGSGASPFDKAMQSLSSSSARIAKLGK